MTDTDFPGNVLELQHHWYTAVTRQSKGDVSTPISRVLGLASRVVLHRLRLLLPAPRGPDPAGLQRGERLAQKEDLSAFRHPDRAVRSSNSSATVRSRDQLVWLIQKGWPEGSSSTVQCSPPGWWSGLRLPKPPRVYVPKGGRPPKPGPEFRFAKQILGWTTPKLRTPEAADRWTWIVLVAHTQLRLARPPLAADLRRSWEKPTASLARVRGGFRNIRAHLGRPTRAPKPPGRRP